jgi:hypothetical protein
MSGLGYLQVIESFKRLRETLPPVFGAANHGFRLNPTLTEEAVVSFEQEHGVSLPNDFRQFLTMVGNGGAGPFYGVFPLGIMDDNFGLRSWQEGDGLIGVLRKPFPFDQEWNDLSMMPADDLADRDEGEYGKQQAEFGSIYWDASLVNGAIPICHEGCAIRIWLVVTGTQAGFLWEDRRSEYLGLRPLKLEDGSQATFGGWYIEWATNCLAATDG